VGPDSPTGRGTFEGGMRRPIVTYLGISASRIVRLLSHAPRFAATSGDTAMRPLAKLKTAIRQLTHFKSLVIMCSLCTI